MASAATEISCNGPDATAGAAGRVSPADLAELIGEFNNVTARLHTTHQRLHAEVARLMDELRRANEQLERSRRLAALGEMAAGIAHEVRNPLGSIRLYARMLVEDLSDRPEERATVRKIDSAAVGLACVVEDMLMFAREFRVRCSPTRAEDLFESAIAACREEGLPGIEAVRFVIVGEGEFAGVDRALMTRALVNLVRNSVQAMDEAGSSVREVTLEAERSCDGFVMRASDTGPGAPPEVTDRMFNPFFTTRQTGTGLGLAIVHRIVEAHGGQVTVRNAPAGGATVEIRVPDAAVVASLGAGDESPGHAAAGAGETFA
ncbi:MAG: hypothetical protein KF787_09590 [Phycisphaeraceae bacterium]|nr:hypothetical protein [Phycisphaerae bacterium]MBX3392884.1 hypothetical protein [Phycisphaeraceae bacterium]